MIPFNVPCVVGTEGAAVQRAMANGHLSGNGPFGKLVQELLAQAYGFRDILLTHSCTGALEMAAMLCGLGPGDEVVLPSFTHVGTANAFARTGATLVWADSRADHPNVDVGAIAAACTPRTRVVVVVHYAGMACDMDALMDLVRRHGLILVEDAAHAIGAQHAGRWLGSFGHMAAFSFHETKNITCGQGGMLVVNDRQYLDPARLIWENGTNRAAFHQGLVAQYSWVGLGSSYTLSDLNAAYLHAQLVGREAVLARRLERWQAYAAALAPLAGTGALELPQVPAGAVHNGHIFYLRMRDRAERDALLAHLRQRGVLGVFHYVPLHNSPFGLSLGEEADLPNCVDWSERIVRLPIYDALTEDAQTKVVEAVTEFLQRRSGNASGIDSFSQILS